MGVGCSPPRGALPEVLGRNVGSNVRSVASKTQALSAPGASLRMTRKLIASGFTVTESTFAGTTAGSKTVEGVSAGPAGFNVDKIVAFGASSVVGNSSGGLKFRWGESSAVGVTTLVVLPVPSSEGMVVELAGLGLKNVKWFDFATEEAGAAGFGAFVFGE